MKRLFTFLALVLGLASCQTEPEGFDVNVGGEQDVNITVSLPESTRAASNHGFDFSDFQNNSKYDLRFILEISYNNKVVREVKTSETTSATFPVRLAPNKDYTFTVWADLVNEDSQDDLYYNILTEDANGDVPGLSNITFKSWTPNVEARDAYTLSKTIKFNAAADLSMELKRPFAKVRVVATDIDKVTAFDLNPTSAVAEYFTAEMYTKFDAVNGSASEVATKKHEFSYTNVDEYDDVTGQFTVFADYVFVPEDGNVQFKLDVNAANGLIKSNNFNTAIPVEANKVTSIVGDVLTEGNNIRVEVKPDFDNANNIEDVPYYQVAVTNAYGYLKAYYEGSQMIALNDIIITPADVEAYLATRAAAAIHPEINLNGYTVTFVTDNSQPLLTIAEGSSFTVNGGSIVIVGDGVGIDNNGTLNIYDVTITVQNDGKAIVNNGAVNINDSEVADDAIENSENAIVGTYVYNADELQAAINAAVKTDVVNEISFGANIAGTVTLVQNPGVKVVINGCDYKYEGSIKIHSNSNFYAGAAVTIKNVNFEASEADVNFIEALENGSQRYSTNVTVEDCTFTATDAAVGTSVALQIKSSKNAKILNSTAQGLHSLVQAQSCDETVVVKDCVVEGKNGVAFKQVKAATVENTTIVAQEYGIRYDGNTDNYGIVVKNNNVTAYQPLIVRKMTGKNNTIALEGENTLTTEEAYKIVITNGSDDAAYVTPTGTYTLTGADNFVVYPRDVVSNWAEFTAALAANKTFVLLANDITYDKSYTITKDITVDLNGKTFAIDNVSAMLNIGDSKNSSKPNVTIKNGNFNTIIYALSGNVTIQDVVFGGTISYVSASQGVVSTKYANLLMENCKMTNVKKSGTTKPRSLCTEGRSSGYLIFRNCNFKNSNLDRPYINPLNGTATLELTNCSLYSGATNIDLGASLVWSNTNLNLNGCSGGFTFTISRASTSLTEDELAVYRAIKQNNNGTKRFIFTDGEKNNL